MKTIARDIALAALEIGAIKLQPQNPFTWTTGYRMPIYNDNRLLMGSFKHRMLVASGFREIIEENALNPQLVAGVAVGGIAPATSLANELELPLAYVPKKAKTHGMARQIEGIFTPGQRTVVIEDLISTGTSSAAALITLRENGLLVNECLSIFSYSFPESKRVFDEIQAKVYSLLTFPELLEVAHEVGKISDAEKSLLASWSESPFEWGAKNGFPKVER